MALPNIMGYGRKSFTSSRTFYVGADYGAQYNAIGQSLVDAASIATMENGAVIYLSPGRYNESIIIPDFCKLAAMAPGAHIAGDAVPGGMIVEVGQGCHLINITIAPTNADKGYGLVRRDATLQAGGVVGGAVNATLILNGLDANPLNDETFLFAGEATTNAVVVKINATAVNVYAYNRFGVVAIISLADTLTIYDSAYGSTANIDLGFIDAVVTTLRESEASCYITNVSILGLSTFSGITGGQKLTVGALMEDRMLGHTLINALSISGADDTVNGRGMVVTRGTVLWGRGMLSEVDNGGIGIEFLNDGITGKPQVLIDGVLMAGNSKDSEGDGKLIPWSINKGFIGGVDPGFEILPLGSVRGMSIEGTYALDPLLATNIEHVLDAVMSYSRSKFIAPEDMYSPLVGGAADVELADQLVKQFVSGADKIVTCKRFHVPAPKSAIRTDLVLRLVCSISVNGGMGDVVEVIGKLIAVGPAELIVSPVTEDITVDEDVSAWLQDVRYDITLTFAAGAIPDPDDEVLLLVMRKGAAVTNDTFAGDVNLWGMWFEE